jgi:hypothetical protein
MGPRLTTVQENTPVGVIPFVFNNRLGYFHGSERSADFPRLRSKIWREALGSAAP